MLFGDTARLALGYAHRAEAQKMPGFDSDVAFELLSRIRQLDWLYDEIGELEREYWLFEEKRRGPRPTDTNWINAFVSSGIPKDLEPTLSIEDRLRVLVESFYYLAHRLLVILDQCSLGLPGLTTIRAPAVRRVRNNLIEHANKPGGRVPYTFSISNVAGVRLRSVGKVGEPDVFLDNGIHNNAVELRDELDAMLHSAIAA